MQQVAAPLASLPDDPVPIVADADFPLAMRGYSREAVDAYVQRASRLVAELHATRSPEIAVRRALERVGEEVSGVLKHAHEVAEQITAQSRREAEDRRQQAHEEAKRITADAERRLLELDADADSLWEERQRLLEDLGELAGELQRVASAAAERFPAADSELQETAEVPRASMPEPPRSEADTPADSIEDPGLADRVEEAPLVGVTDEEAGVDPEQDATTQIDDGSHP